MTADRLAEVLVWSLMAFGFWILLIAPLRRLRLPQPIAVAAALGWILARLCLWTVPLLLHWMRTMV